MLSARVDRSMPKPWASVGFGDAWHEPEDDDAEGGGMIPFSNTEVVIEDSDSEVVVTKRRKKRKNKPKTAESKAKIRRKTDRIEEAVTDAITDDDWRVKHGVVLSGEPTTVALFKSFSDTPFHSAIISQLESSGFVEPLAIQAQSWPIIAAGNDIIGVCPTGSGKTLAFLVPTISRILDSKLARATGGRGAIKQQPELVVMTPTRELALQIHSVAETLATAVGIKCAVVYGGAGSRGRQMKDLQDGVSVIVATPGRLLDLMTNGGKPATTLSHVQSFVLDEADRMLVMGLLEDITTLIKMCPTVSFGRQTLLFSATWQPVVQAAAAKLLHRPVQVNVGAIDRLVTNKNVRQLVEVLDSDKYTRLKALLNKIPNTDRVLVFCNSKSSCRRVSGKLRDEEPDLFVGSLHGDKTQQQREEVLAQFRSGEMNILIATDVAARGLDVTNVEQVINYEFPPMMSDYVHRIGRTGRNGLKGVATTLLDEFRDKKHAKPLANLLAAAGQECPAGLEALCAQA